MADMNTPPGAHDIYEVEELYSALAKLISAYIDVPRWLLKIDDEFGGRGHAFVDVHKLRTAVELRKERQKYLKAGTKDTGAGLMCRKMRERAS